MPEGEWCRVAAPHTIHPQVPQISVKTSTGERRAQARYSVVLPIAFGEVRGLTSEIGLSGGRFTARGVCSIGDEGKVAIDMSRGKLGIELVMRGVGRVIRSQTLPDGRSEVAFVFDSLEVSHAGVLASAADGTLAGYS
jgi:hypothetical protein